jgi:hypothetical protein
MKCLPGGEQEISFLPVHTAAGALVDLRNSTSLFLHLAHPRRVPWSSLIQPLSTHLGAAVVPYSEWVTALEESLADAPSEVEAVRKNPALKILPVFQASLHAPAEGRESLGLPRLDTTESVRGSTTLQAEQPLGPNDVKLWLEYWRSIGFLST